MKRFAVSFLGVLMIVMAVSGWAREKTAGTDIKQGGRRLYRQKAGRTVCQ